MGSHIKFYLEKYSTEGLEQAVDYKEELLLSLLNSLQEEQRQKVLETNNVNIQGSETSGVTFSFNFIEKFKN